VDGRNSIPGKGIYFSLHHHNQALLKSIQWIPRDPTPVYLLQNVPSETDSAYSSHHGDPRSIPGQSTKDLIDKVALTQVSPPLNTSLFPRQHHSTNST
jgi:hypothetical protein